MGSDDMSSIDWRKYLRTLINPAKMKALQAVPKESKGGRRSIRKMPLELLLVNADTVFREITGHLKIRNRNLDDAILKWWHRKQDTLVVLAGLNIHLCIMSIWMSTNQKKSLHKAL